MPEWVRKNGKVERAIDAALDEISGLYADQRLTTKKLNSMLDAMDKFEAIDHSLTLVFDSLRKKLL